jgi:hypothetical protein
VAVLNQALKKLEESLKKETDRRKALEAEMQFLKALDKKLAKAGDEFNRANPVAGAKGENRSVCLSVVKLRYNLFHMICHTLQ